jgi:hypothetical protein
MIHADTRGRHLPRARTLRRDRAAGGARRGARCQAREGQPQLVELFEAAVLRHRETAEAAAAEGSEEAQARRPAGAPKARARGLPARRCQGCPKTGRRLRRADAPPRTIQQVGLVEKPFAVREHGEAYFTFVTTPGVEPTSKLAERAIRFVAIDRRITQGTRGETGRRWCERIRTAVATCARQGRSLCRFLAEAVQAHFSGSPAPSLLPRPP